MVFACVLLYGMNKLNSWHICDCLHDRIKQTLPRTIPWSYTIGSRHSSIPKQLRVWLSNKNHSAIGLTIIFVPTHLCLGVSCLLQAPLEGLSSKEIREVRAWISLHDPRGAMLLSAFSTSNFRLLSGLSAVYFSSGRKLHKDPEIFNTLCKYWKISS